MTASNKDPEEWKEIIGNKRYTDENRKKNRLAGAEVAMRNN